VAAKDVRKLVYQYNGNERGEEVEEDVTVKAEIPIIGSTLKRHGRGWKVIRVIAPVSRDGTTPLVRVFLSDRVQYSSRLMRPVP
jgi:hypothetical protein